MSQPEIHRTPPVFTAEDFAERRDGEWLFNLSVVGADEDRILAAKGYANEEEIADLDTFQERCLRPALAAIQEKIDEDRAELDGKPAR